MQSVILSPCEDIVHTKLYTLPQMMYSADDHDFCYSQPLEHGWGDERYPHLYLIHHLSLDMAHIGFHTEINELRADALNTLNVEVASQFLRLLLRNIVEEPPL